MDEVFGADNFVSLIAVTKTSSSSGNLLSAVNDYIVWYAKDKASAKYRQLYVDKEIGGSGGGQYTWGEESSGHRQSYSKSRIEDAATLGSRVFRPDNMTSQRPAGAGDVRVFAYEGKSYTPGKGTFKSDLTGLTSLARARRLLGIGNTLCYVRFLDDFPVFPIVNDWEDTGASGFGDPKMYVVQTLSKVVERCVLMASDPGDLVIDPTCGSGTTAYVAEQWGRRWITVDTSRVALALARARIMGARYPYFFLSDSPEGQRRESDLVGAEPSSAPTRGDIRHGFVYERVPHIMLSSIANNVEIDVIWETYQATLEPLREALNAALGESWEEWEIPRDASEGWSADAKSLHAQWWEARIARQREIDASIVAKADHEHLYDRPYEDRSKVRVAGPFTVESLSPHRVLGVDENDELIDGFKEATGHYGEPQDFATMILEHLRTAGVQQAHKDDAIAFTSITPWPGQGLICAEGRYLEGRARRSAPASSSAPSSARSPAPTSWMPRARPATQASTCSSPAPSTTRRTPASSAASAASRCSKRA